jgi:kynurenine 3-monooxygenase
MKVAIVGSGLVGSLQAILMAKKGYQVSVFERRDDLRKAKLIAGRSINLALSDRGWKAMKLAGIEDDILKIAIPMYKRCMHAVDGKLTYQPYGKENQAIYSVSRGELNQKLMNLADQYPNIDYNFNRKCEDIDLKTNTLSFLNSETNQEELHTFDRVFATDGTYSAIRTRLQKSTVFNYTQAYLDHGYKELYIPANPDGTHQLEPNCLHIWPRGEFMMIALANLDGSFTCTLFFPMKGEVSFESLKTEELVFDFFQKTFADLIPLMPDLLERYFNNPTSTLMTVRCEPWNYKDQVLLLGDSAHAMVPFYGQGMNCGFEDCTVLNGMLEEADGNWDGLLDRFSAQRVPDGNAIIDLALDNYIEMRDLTGDPEFLLQKKIEAKFATLYPNKWMPLYSQVTFSDTRYSDAYRNGKKQDALMKQILAMDNIHENWDAPEVMDKLNTLVNE